MTERLPPAPVEVSATSDCDVLIVGAGPVGMALARALAGSALRVVLIDARAARSSSGDPRALALAHGSQQLLERLQAWNARAATPMTEVHVSQRGGFGRTLISADDYGVPALGYVMAYGDLAAALGAGLAPGQLSEGCRIENITADRDQAMVTIAQSGATRRVRARLVVHAEGAAAAAADVSVRDYRQTAIVTDVGIASPHRQRAWERFTADGPLALLPHRDGYALVLTVAQDKAPALLECSDDDFLAALRERFGRRIDFVSCAARSSFPLALRLRRELVAPRQVWIGNSAQTLHPVSGQGFNLGLRDAVELAAALLADGPSDPGAAATLAAYARGRRIDRRFGAAFTDGIVSVFSNDIAPLRCARGIGLLALDLAPPLRDFVAKRMIWGARAWP